MRSINPDKLAVVHITTQPDYQRIVDSPPHLSQDNVTPEAVEELLDKTRRSAYCLDIYKDIVQFSILYQDMTWHVMYCDDPELTLDAVKYPNAMLCKYETDLVNIACKWLNGIFIPNNIGVILAGWQLKVHVWPMLVCKALKYNHRLSEMLLHDPSQNFDHNDYRLDVSNIYTQGVNSRERSIPAMVDVIKEWTGIRLESMDNLKESLCLDPVKAIHITDTYLRTMRDVIIKYKQMGELTCAH